MFSLHLPKPTAAVAEHVPLENHRQAGCQGCGALWRVCERERAAGPGAAPGSASAVPALGNGHLLGMSQFGWKRCAPHGINHPGKWLADIQSQLSKDISSSPRILCQAIKPSHLPMGICKKRLKRKLPSNYVL